MKIGTTLVGGAVVNFVEQGQTRIEIDGHLVTIVHQNGSFVDEALRRFASTPGIVGDVTVVDNGRKDVFAEMRDYLETKNGIWPTSVKTVTFSLVGTVDVPFLYGLFSDYLEQDAWVLEKAKIEAEVPVGFDLPVRRQPLRLEQPPQGDKEVFKEAGVVFVDGRPAAICQEKKDSATGRVNQFWTCLKGFRTYSNSFNTGLRLVTYAANGKDKREFSVGLAQYASDPYVKILAEHGGDQRIIDIIGGYGNLVGRKLYKSDHAEKAVVETRTLEVHLYGTFAVLNESGQWLLVPRGGYHVVDNTKRGFDLYLFTSSNQWANGSAASRRFQLTIPVVGEKRKLHERDDLSYNETGLLYLITDLNRNISHNNFGLRAGWMLAQKKETLSASRWTRIQRYTGDYADGAHKVRSVDLI